MENAYVVEPLMVAGWPSAPAERLPPPSTLIVPVTMPPAELNVSVTLAWMSPDAPAKSAFWVIVVGAMSPALGSKSVIAVLPMVITNTQARPSNAVSCVAAPGLGWRELARRTKAPPAGFSWAFALSSSCRSASASALSRPDSRSAAVVPNSAWALSRARSCAPASASAGPRASPRATGTCWSAATIEGSSGPVETAASGFGSAAAEPWAVPGLAPGVGVAWLAQAATSAARTTAVTAPFHPRIPACLPGPGRGRIRPSTTGPRRP